MFRQETATEVKATAAVPIPATAATPPAATLATTPATAVPATTNTPQILSIDLFGKIIPEIKWELRTNPENSTMQIVSDLYSSEEEAQTTATRLADSFNALLLSPIDNIWTTPSRQKEKYRVVFELETLQTALKSSYPDRLSLNVIDRDRMTADILACQTYLLKLHQELKENLIKEQMRDALKQLEEDCRRAREIDEKRAKERADQAADTRQKYPITSISLIRGPDTSSVQRFLLEETKREKKEQEEKIRFARTRLKSHWRIVKSASRYGKDIKAALEIKNTLESNGRFPQSTHLLQVLIDVARYMEIERKQKSRAETLIRSVLSYVRDVTTTTDEALFTTLCNACENREHSIGKALRNMKENPVANFFSSREDSDSMRHVRDLIQQISVLPIPPRATATAAATAATPSGAAAGAGRR